MFILFLYSKPYIILDSLRRQNLTDFTFSDFDADTIIEKVKAKGCYINPRLIILEPKRSEVFYKEYLRYTFEPPSIFSSALSYMGEYIRKKKILTILE